MSNKFLLDTFYALNKEYGTRITYTKVGKGDIDADTGKRDSSADSQFNIPAIVVPVDISLEFLLNIVSRADKLLGRIEKTSTTFLVRASDLPLGVATEDFMTHGSIKYRNMQYEDYAGVLYGLAGEKAT